MKFARSQRSIESKKFFFIVITWTIIGSILSIYDHFLITSHLTGGYNEGYFFFKSGYTLVYLVNKRYRAEPYYKSVIIVCIAFILAISFITLTLAFLQATILHGGLGTAAGLKSFQDLIYTTEHVKNIIFWAIIVALTQLGLQINDKFGQGLLWSMITGKYHLPKTEERIFMFLDLKGSTTIAEKLGNKKYHHLLKDLFSDITDPILANGGQIYQYVGDEVVISWKVENGISRNSCLNCFFDVQSTLTELADKYLDHYQIQPVFKAGIHYGKVIAGEVGIIKRDITYSGDILNTTARIQGMCNEHQTNLLVSGSLANLLSLNSFRIKNLGSLQLRGKLETVELVSIEQ